MAGFGWSANFNKTGSEINLTDNNTDKITNLNRKEDENACD